MTSNCTLCFYWQDASGWGWATSVRVLEKTHVQPDTSLRYLGHLTVALSQGNANKECVVPSCCGLLPMLYGSVSAQ
jgi:hypothetical protein